MADEAGLGGKDDLRRRFAKTFVFPVDFIEVLIPGLQVTSQEHGNWGWMERSLVRAADGWLLAHACNTTITERVSTNKYAKGVHEYVDGAQRRYIAHRAG